MNKLFVRVVCVFVTALWMGCAESGDSPPQLSRAQIEQQIAKEIPTGTPRSQVIAYLDAHRIQNSGSSTSVPGDELWAIYRRVEGSTSIVRKDIQVVFYFKDGVLTHYTTAEKLTGP